MKPPKVRSYTIPPHLLEFARKLRREPTPTEDLLWELLRDRRFGGYKFRRQASLLDAYIADFYCARAHLVIELDGSGHAEENQAAYDAARDTAFRAIGLRVFRVWNSEVSENLEGVLETLWNILQE